MVDAIKNLEFEYKAALIMGLGAIVLSILIGIASGVSAGALLIRSLFVLPVFAGMGFGASTVIKKFVPELYGLLSLKGDESVPDVGMKEDVSEAAGKPAVEIEKNSEDLEKNSVESTQKDSDPLFQEFSKSDFPKVEEPKSQTDDSFLNVSLETDSALSNKTGKNSGDRRLGKHIVMSESFGKYEPKIMAQAIRTMLKREGD
jgi:hypothetical protein